MFNRESNNLYSKELIAIDGSKFKACNSKDRNFTFKKLNDRIARLDKKIDEYLQTLEKQDQTEPNGLKNRHKCWKLTTLQRLQMQVSNIARTIRLGITPHVASSDNVVANVRQGHIKSFEMTMKPCNFSKDYNNSDLWVKQMGITADKKIVRQRKYLVKHPFGTIKRAMNTE